MGYYSSLRLNNKTISRLFLYCHCILSPLNHRAKTELSLRGPWVDLVLVPRVCGAKNGPSRLSRCIRTYIQITLHTPICSSLLYSPFALGYLYIRFLGDIALAR